MSQIYTIRAYTISCMNVRHLLSFIMQQYHSLRDLSTLNIYFPLQAKRQIKRISETISLKLKFTCYVNILSKLSIIFKEWRVIVLFLLQILYTYLFCYNTIQYNAIQYFFIPIKVPQGAMTNIHSQLYQQLQLYRMED